MVIFLIKGFDPSYVLLRVPCSLSQGEKESIGVGKATPHSTWEYII